MRSHSEGSNPSEESKSKIKTKELNIKKKGAMTMKVIINHTSKFIQLSWVVLGALSLLDLVGVDRLQSFAHYINK